MSDVDVSISGPLFGPGAENVLREFCREVETSVANQILSDWMQGLDAKIRNPTPYYETQLRVVASTNGMVVDDRGVIYGPWLEGTSSRNSTTRFRGYGQLRAARQAVEGKINGLIAHAYSRALARLNGGVT